MREIINKLESRKDFLAKILKQIEDREASYPEGRLRIRNKNDKGVYYRILDKNDSCGLYIPRKDDELARKLAQKEYEKKYKKHALEELESINRFLAKIDKCSCTDFYSKLNPIRKKLIRPFEISDSDTVDKWKSIDYEGLKFRDDDTSNYITDAGERVRSKSELVIANMLNKNNIPYKYECPLRINNYTIYPDFTMLNVKKRKVLYWEHFGMMGDTEYCNNALKKILSYSNGNIIIGDKLIATFESLNVPIDVKQINKLINYYLT